MRPARISEAAQLPETLFAARRITLDAAGVKEPGLFGYDAEMGALKGGPWILGGRG